MASSSIFLFLLAALCIFDLGLGFSVSSMPLSGQGCMRRSVQKPTGSSWSMLAKVVQSIVFIITSNMTIFTQAKSDKLQVLLKSTVEGVGKANQVVQVR
jgi:hypothetical protein